MHSGSVACVDSSINTALNCILASLGSPDPTHVQQITSACCKIKRTSKFHICCSISWSSFIQLEHSALLPVAVPSRIVSSTACIVSHPVRTALLFHLSTVVIWTIQGYWNTTINWMLTWDMNMCEKASASIAACISKIDFRIMCFHWNILDITYWSQLEFFRKWGRRQLHLQIKRVVYYCPGTMWPYRFWYFNWYTKWPPHNYFENNSGCA